VPSSQALGIYSSELDTPESGDFVADYYASFGQRIYDIPVVKIESLVEPDCVTDDIGRELVAFVVTHGPILTVFARLICQHPLLTYKPLTQASITRGVHYCTILTIHPKNHATP
jgi:hypothetical protein